MKETLKRVTPYLLLTAFVAFALCITAEPAYAVGGLQRVDTFMQNILQILRGISVVVVSIALIWTGYKFLFQHADIMECGKILGAALLIGGATEIAHYLLGT